MATSATYKVYNGSSWVEYYFRTSAALVGTDGLRQFVSASTKVNGKGFLLNSDGSRAECLIDGSDIEGMATPVSGYSLVNIGQYDTIAVALGKLDHEIEIAKSSIPSGVLTTSNFATNYPDLDAIESLSGNSGFLKKTGANTWALDTNTYLTSVTVNGQSGSNITIYGTDIYTRDGSGILTYPTVTDAIEALQNQTSGLTTSYAIDATGTFSSNQLNAQLNSTNPTVTIQVQYADWSTACFKTVSDNTVGSVLLSELHIGDNIFITETNLPDRWVSAIDTSHLDLVHETGYAEVTFAQLESYNMTWGAITNKPTTIAGYGITDAKITESNGEKTITLGSNTYTATSSNFTALWGQTVTVGVVGGVSLQFTMPSQPSYSDTQNTAGATNNQNTRLYLVGATTQGTAPQTYSNSGLYVDSNNRLYANSQACITCTVGTSQPSSGVSGDIWIDTSN